MQPIDENTLITLINQANGTNLNNNTRKHATQQLMNLQTASGYPSTLLKIWQSSQPDTLRLTALAQFKNHAVNNFIHTKNTQEKEHCKNLLLTTYLNEKSEQICKQISQCIAKLARREWPNNWSLLFSILVNNIKSDNASCVLRTAFIISDILSEISSMRLPMYQQDINKLSSQLLPILFSIWTKGFTYSFSMFETKQNCDLNKLYKFLSLCLFLSKSIRILIKKSYELEFSNNSIGGQYLNKSLEVIQKLHDRYYIQLISHKNSNNKPLADVIKCINSILKILLITIRETHQQFTLSFRIILPNFLSYYYHLITKHNKNKNRNNNNNNNNNNMKNVSINNNLLFLNEVIVYALLFLYDVCKLQQYSGKNISGILFTGKKIKFNESDANECKMLVTHFFNKERLTNIIECLISDLFILSKFDLSERRIDPCLIWQQHHIEHNSDNIRAAAKQLFRVLVKKYPSICGPVVVNMFKNITSNNNNNMNINNINYKQLDPTNDIYKHFFLRESIYLALGLKYFEISPFLSELGCKFSNICEILSSDLKLYGYESGYRIPFLATRIIWLFGKLKEDINRHKDIKQYIYKNILQHMTGCNNNNNDLDLENEILLLRLDSAEALYSLLDDNGFECREYTHLLKQTFILLLSLVSDCDQSLECMQDILRYICCVIKQNNEILSCSNNFEMQSIVSSIFIEMGKCWDNCNTTETNLCRVNLIECITQLIGCMKSQSVHKLYNKLIPIISYCTESKSIDDDNRICLIDCGLELWHKVLYHSYELTNDMNKLFKLNWIPQMKVNSDYFDILMSILKSYLFLGGGQFVQTYAKNIEQILTIIIPDISDLDDSFKQIIEVLCVFIQLFPEQSPKFLFKIIKYLIFDFIKIQSGQTTTHLKIECYMLFFCRLLLVNTDGTLNIFNQIQLSEQTNNQNLIKQLFNYMFICKNNVKQFYKQKIVVLGLLKIFHFIILQSNNDQNIILQLLTQLLPWSLYVIKETEIECLEFADDMHPEININNKIEWTEADRISNLYCNDFVSHTFMIDIIIKTLNDSAQKLNINLKDLLIKIQSKIENNNNNNNVIQDCKYCIDKYNHYVKNKDNQNDS